MKPISRLYLMIFLIMGLPFAILMALFDYVFHDEFIIYKFLAHFVFFGASMSLFLVYYTKKSLKKKGIKEFTSEALNVKQFRVITSTISKQVLLNRLGNDPIYGKMYIIEKENGFVIKTKLSWHSWGETINIIINDMNTETQSFHISSQPIIPTTLIDYGKNKDNIDGIEKIILGN